MKLVLPASRNPVNKYTGTSIFCSELKSENLLYFIVVDAGADDTKSADDTCCAIANVGLCGNVIKVDPLSVLPLYDTLGTQNHTEGVVLGEGLENALDLGDGELLGGLTAEAGEYLVGVMMVVTVVMASAFAMLIVVVVMMLVTVLVASAFAMLVVVVVVMLVLVATAFAMLVVVVMVMLVLVATAFAMLIVVVMLVTVATAFTVLIVVVVMMLVLVASAFAMLVVVVVVMLVTVAAAFAMLIVVVMVMLVTVLVASAFTVLVVVVMVMLVTVASAFAVLVVIVVMMTVLVASAFAVLVVVVVVMLVMMLMLLLELCKCALEGVLLLHSGEDILAVELVPRSGNDGSGRVVLSDELDCRLNLLCLGKVGVGEDDGGCVGDLVVIELAKVLHIHLTLVNVGNGGEAIELGVGGLNRLNSLDNVGELTYSAGLNDNSIGVELVKHLDKRLGKIADEGAADATGVHLGDLDACVLKESAVDTDLTEFVLDKNELFAAVCFLNKLLYKCGLAGSEEAGKNIYFRHFQKICPRANLLKYIA